MKSEKFCGKLKTIRLNSELSLFLTPALGTEVGQRLTITRDGRGFLTRSTFGAIPDGGSKENLFDKKKQTRFHLNLEHVERIMRAFEETFSNPDDEIVLALDTGCWDLELENVEGKKFRWHGSLIEESFPGAEELSDLVREETGIENLFVFDGCPDRIEEIEFRYHQKTAIHPKGFDGQTVYMKINESLAIDRKTETLKHVHGLSPECEVTNIYHINGGIPKLLDVLKDLELTDREGNPPDVVDDPDDVKEYSLKIRWRSGQVDQMDGTYDKLSLPEDFPKLVRKVWNFITFYGLGEFFNEDAYSRKKRRESDLIFCKVIFADAEKEYTYLADEDIYKKGDFAWAPAGKDNEKKIVRVTDVKYLQPEEAPFPLEKTKKLIRKLTPEEYEKYVEDGENY